MSIKKKLLFSLAAVLLWTLPGCKEGEISDNEYPINDISVYLLTETESYSNGVKTSYDQYKYDQSGHRTSHYSYVVQNPSEALQSIERKYDYMGNLIQEIRYSDGVEYWRNDYQYDQMNNLVLDICYQDRVEQSRTEYQYDTANREIYCAQYNLGELTYEISYTYTCTYNNAGKMISEICFANNEESSRYEWEYDTDGNMIQEIYTVSTGSRIIKYDSSGNTIHIEDTISTLDDSTYTHDYEYDNNNSLIAEAVKRGSRRIYWEYDSEGRIITRIDYLAGKEKSRQSRRYECQYDESNNKIFEICYTDSGEYSRTLYKYDDNGCPIKITVSNNGTDENVTETTYVYKEFILSIEHAQELLELYGDKIVFIKK